MSEFGKLRKIHPREVWDNEATKFTPWLADNLFALGEALGIDLELDSREAAVGRYSLDLLAHDVNGNRPVVIENQLTPTDHDHLGKLITYASGYEAGVVVWIAPEINEEHRQALDWLNQRTDANVEFFGVVVEVLKIDNSLPAYSFRPVAFPNEWRKGHVSVSGKASERGEAYRGFFVGLLSELREQHKFTNARAPGPVSWYLFSSGNPAFTYEFSFAQGDRARSGIYIDDRKTAEANKALFDTLAKEKDSLEKQMGEELVWERLDNKRASKIAAYREGSIDEPETLEDVKRWAIEHLLRFKKVFGPKIDSLSR